MFNILDSFTHQFLSPVTGKVLAMDHYALVGDHLGVATPSPALLDIKLDLQALREDMSTAQNNRVSFIMGYGDASVKSLYPEAQFLDNLEDGILKHVGGQLSPALPSVDFLIPSDLDQLREEFLEFKKDIASISGSSSDAIKAAQLAAVHAATSATHATSANNAADKAKSSAEAAAEAKDYKDQTIMHSKNAQAAAVTAAGDAVKSELHADAAKSHLTNLLGRKLKAVGDVQGAGKLSDDEIPFTFGDFLNVPVTDFTEDLVERLKPGVAFVAPHTPLLKSYLTARFFKKNNLT